MSALRRCLAVRPQFLTHRGVRTMGGAPAHHDAHGLSQGAQAYAAQTPYLFGEAVSAFSSVEALPLAHGVRGREPWERPFYFTLVGTIVCFLVASQYYRPTTHEWARDEAEERLRREAAGLPVLRGVNYAGIRYMKETNVISEEEALALEEGKVVAPLPTVIPQ